MVKKHVVAQVEYTPLTTNIVSVRSQISPSLLSMVP